MEKQRVTTEKSKKAASKRKQETMAITKSTKAKRWAVASTVAISQFRRRGNMPWWLEQGRKRHPLRCASYWPSLRVFRRDSATPVSVQLEKFQRRIEKISNKNVPTKCSLVEVYCITPEPQLSPAKMDSTNLILCLIFSISRKISKYSKMTAPQDQIQPTKKET